MLYFGYFPPVKFQADTTDAERRNLRARGKSARARRDAEDQPMVGEIPRVDAAGRAPVSPPTARQEVSRPKPIAPKHGRCRLPNPASANSSGGGVHGDPLVERHGLCEGMSHPEQQRVVEHPADQLNADR
jgi:hypothetical protein